MKTPKLEKLLLLEQSGELSSRQRRCLDRELRRSAEARRMRDSLQIMRAAVAVPETEPAPWSVVKINARLRGELRAVTLSRVLKPALALAACLLVAVSLFEFSRPAPSPVVAVTVTTEVDVWNDPLGEDLDKLENLILAISGDPLDVMEM